MFCCLFFRICDRSPPELLTFLVLASLSIFDKSPPEASTFFPKAIFDMVLYIVPASVYSSSRV
jgi:hypothetical protein